MAADSSAGPNLAQLDSMNQASQQQQNNNHSGAGLPAANGAGIDSQVGGQVGQNFSQQSNMDNNLAGVGGIDPVIYKPSFSDDVITKMTEGNMSQGNIEYSQVFAANNTAFGDVSAASFTSPGKALNSKEGGHSFGNIGDIASR